MVLQGFVFIGEFEEGPSHSVAHHGGGEVLAIGGAAGNVAAIAVFRERVAAHGFAVGQGIKRVGGRIAAGPVFAPFGFAFLRRFGRVDAVDAIARAIHIERVAVHDQDRVGESWTREERQCEKGVFYHVLLCFC